MLRPALLLASLVLGTTAACQSAPDTGAEQAHAPAPTTAAEPTAATDGSADVPLSTPEGEAAPAEAQAIPRPDPPVVEIGGERPAELHVPAIWDGRGTYPIVVLLHGFGGTGAGHAAWFDMVAAADEAGALLVVPDGTPLPDGRRFWDATPECCAFGHGPVDDVGYVVSLVDEVVRDWAGDTERVVVVGHSNGGYMAHRLACDAADRVHAIVSLAGSTFNDPTRCQPVAAVNVLNLHGDADPVVWYGEGDDAPGAEETTARWVALNGCDHATVDAGPIDLDAEVPGAETSMRTWPLCRDGVRVALWTMHDTDHNPGFRDGRFARAALDWALEGDAAQ